MIRKAQFWDCPRGSITVIEREEERPEVTVRLHPRMRKCYADALCAAFLLGVVLWILIEIVPAFFDGRVAAVVGGY
jgi:hypothetical protein